MKLHRPCLLALALGIAVISAPAAAQWKWRDAQGKVQYSDLPPPHSVPDSAVLKRPPGAAAESRPSAAGPAPAQAAASSATAASAPASKAAATGLDKDVEARRRAEEQENEAKRKAEEQRTAKERAAQCAQARGYLLALENGERLKRTNAGGEREVIDDAQRSQEIAQTRKTLATHCK